MDLIRLDKAISSQTSLSRREVKALAARGKILLNGHPVKSADIKISMESDSLLLNGAPLELRRFSYLMLNKPSGVVCATSDQKLPTVLDLVPEEERRSGLFPAGRLDKDTEGFVLITNDGELAHRILAPKSHVAKIYLARLSGPFGQAEIDAFAQGVLLSPEPGRRERLRCLPAELRHEGELARVTLRQGMYHQIKRMFEALGLRVLSLKRVQIGALPLDESLASGGCRRLEKGELELLCRQPEG